MFVFVGDTGRKYPQWGNFCCQGLLLAVGHSKKKQIMACNFIGSCDFQAKYLKFSMLLFQKRLATNQKVCLSKTTYDPQMRILSVQYCISFFCLLLSAPCRCLHVMFLCPDHMFRRRVGMLVNGGVCIKKYQYVGS